MLLHKYQYPYLYNSDESKANPDTQQDKAGQDNKANDEKQFSQADLDKLLGSTRKSARETGKKEVLDELGIDNLEALKAMLKAQKEKEEADKSEAQKALDKLAEKDKEIAELKAKHLEAESKRIAQLRDTSLLALLTSAFDANEVLLLLKAKYPERVTNLILEDGSFDSKEAEKLVGEYRSANARHFKGEAKGSPSNSDGRLLKPEAAVKEQAAKEMKGKFGI